MIIIQKIQIYDSKNIFKRNKDVKIECKNKDEVEKLRDRLKKLYKTTHIYFEKKEK